MTKSMQITERKPGRINPSENPRSFKWTRAFDSPGPIDPEVLGNKGASLAEMTRLGLPVPPGFTLTSEVWQVFKSDGELPKEIWQETLEQLRALEKKTGKIFADKDNPLLVSVRSGAKYSMPGMMNTVLNAGLTAETMDGLARQIGEAAAKEAYEKLVETFTTSGQEKKLPRDPYRQLYESMVAVLDSWNNRRAVEYRHLTGIPHDSGRTAVTIQEIVLGNLPDGQSGSGVFFTRNPQTGEKKIWGEFAQATQGVEIVSGTGKGEALEKSGWTEKLEPFAKTLETHFKAVQDVEFTIERGKIWLLQTRKARLHAGAAATAAYDMWQEGLISQKEAFYRLSPEQIEALTRPLFSEEQETEARNNSLVATGKTASPGAARGFLATTPEKAREMAKAGQEAVLMVDYFDPNEIGTLFESQAIVTRIGGMASHMALVMHAAGIPGIVNCQAIQVKPGEGVVYDGKIINEGEKISVDATSGEVFKGWLDYDKPPSLSPELKTFLEERKKYFGESAWSVALYPLEQPFHRGDFLKKIAAKILPEIKKWNSPKAVEVVVLNGLFPQDDIIQSKILDPNDLEGIAKAILAIYRNKGYEAIPRSIHTREGLGKEPWTNVPKDKIRDFLYDANYIGNPTHPEYRGLPQWKENPNLVAVLMPAEPVGKMDKALYAQHFAFTVACLATQPPKVVIDISLGNPHLREIEKISPETLIEITTLVNNETPSYLGQTTFDFGSEHFDQDNLKKLMRAYAGKPTGNPLAKQVLGVIRQKYGTGIPQEVETKTMVNMLSELGRSGSLTKEMYQFLIKKRALTIAQLVANRVLSDWWKPPFALPHLMSALDDTFRFSVIEGQGRMEDNDTVPWYPKVYGLKGPQEAALVSEGKSAE